MALTSRPVNRRRLLTATAEATGLALLGTPLGRLAFGAETALDAPALVMIFLRGGADGLSIVPPISGEDRRVYEAERPTVQIAAKGDNAALPLDARFGLHPAASDLHALWRDKKLAVVHAVGMTQPNRSHFDAQTMVELGTGRKSGDSGWLARAMAAAHRGSAARGESIVAVSSMLPTMLYGAGEAIALPNANGLNLGGPKPEQGFQRLALRELYADAGWIGHLGTAALDAFDRFDGLGAGDYTPTSGVDYPKGELGNKLKALAQLLRLPLGLAAAEVDFGGWDTHKNQGDGHGGPIADRLGQLSGSVAALLRDMAGAKPARRVTIVVMSEFGRRFRENANRGTDHGHGNVMLLAGHRVSGGRVYGAWPGLTTEKLYDRADLAVTTDYRQPLFEVTRALLSREAATSAFPGFTPGAALGVMA